MMFEKLFIHHIIQLKILCCPFQQTGDNLYKRDEAGEIIDDGALEDSIEDIIVTQLQD